MTSSSTISARSAKGRVVVGIGDLAVSDDPRGTLVTFALGSCIGVAIHDPIARVGGLLHFMLPSGKVNPQKAETQPAMFGDRGVPMLFRACYELGATKENLIVIAAGGAEVLGDDGHFRIGSRNRTMLRKIFWQNDVLVAASDTGGSVGRTMTLSMADGSVTIRSQGKDRTLWPQ